MERNHGAITERSGITERNHGGGGVEWLGWRWRRWGGGVGVEAWRRGGVDGVEEGDLQEGDLQEGDLTLHNPP